jgi:tape measure domain-containing protein
MANELTIKLNADVSQALRNVSRLRDENGRFIAQSRNPAAMGVKGPLSLPSMRPATSGIAAMSSGLDGVGSKFMSIAKWGTVALAGAVAVGAAAATTQIIKLGVQAEQTRMSFQTMLGSAAKGNAMLGMLNQFANVTPFSNSEVIAAGKTLLSFGVSAGNVKGILKTVGDVSAGTGKSFTELSSIFGKVFAKGKADSETLNQMSEAGIPIVKTLGAMYNKSGAEIYKMAENGQLSAAVIQQAFQKMTGDGGVFSNMMAKQSETVGGLWSTVTGQLELFAATLGESVTPLLKSGLQYIMGWVDELAAMSQDGRAVEYLAMIGITGVQAIGNMMKWFNRFYEYGTAVFNLLGRIVKIEFEIIQGVIATAFGTIVTVGLNSINALIAAANKIPGVDIKMVDKPQWLEQINQWAKLSAAEVQKEVGAITSGKDFKDAGNNIDRKNAEIDKGMSTAEGFISNWQSKAQEELIRRKLDEKKYEKELNGPGTDITAAAAPGKKTPAEKIQIDELTRVGGYNYNFGANSIKSIDVERNSLLRQIRDKLDKQPETTLA